LIRCTSKIKITFSGITGLLVLPEFPYAFPEGIKILTFPSSYMMPQIDHNSSNQKFKKEISKYSKTISVHSLNNFLRRELLDDCKLLTSPFL